MSRNYDNWEKLVEAVLRREKDRQLALSESFSSSVFSFDSDVPAALGIPGDTLELGANSDSHDAVPLIKFKELEKTTKNFHHAMLLGQGAFGDVYKGWINELTLRASKPRSGVAVAVKKWRDGSFHGYEEYMKEIKYLSQLRHPNLVKLIGCCSEEGNMILVYEFMPRGSLYNHLFTRGHQSLSWATRMKVAVGVAKAISFLHDLPTPVIHRGFQCGNILLDADFNPKLSDCGFARDGPIGGMAPEYLMAGHLTEKADVYSFGVVLLELLSGRRVLKENQPWLNINEWGNKTKMLQIMDTKLKGQYPYNEAYSLVKLACRCLSKTPVERPRMAEVVVALQQLE